MFPVDSMSAEGFTWKTALGAALCSDLAYQNGPAVENVARNLWNFGTCQFVAEGSTECFIASTDNAVVVAFRGTLGFWDWVTDSQVLPTRRDYGTVHTGFCKGFERVTDRLTTLVESLTAGGKKLLITGHSLGGALAVISAAVWHDRFPVTSVYTFGQPRTGKADLTAFAADRYSARYYRFVNADDLVTRVPPNYQHFGNLLHFDEHGALKGELPSDAGGGSTEFPPLSEAEFEDLQRIVEQTQQRARAVTFSEAEAEAMTAITLEGVVPGVSNHSLDRYIAHIRRFARETRESDIDSTLEMSREFRATEAIAESVRRSYHANFSEEGSPVLIRLKEPIWQPPANLKIQSSIGVFVTAKATDTQLQALKRDQNVLSIEASRDAGLSECAVSIPFVRADVVHQAPLAERGDQAVIGVIDSGIDVLQECFLHNDGTTRILSIWNQRDDSGPTPHAVDPAAFTQDYGTYYESVEIRRMVEGEATVPPALRDPAVDDLGNPVAGHGTHVSSIAAGRAVGTFGGGVAPEARLMVVIPNMVTKPGDPRSIGYSNSHIDAVSFLKSAAAKVGLPMAVNVSQGMNAGAHDGLSNLEATFDALSNNGKEPGFAIVKSAGNEGNTGGHAAVKAFQGAGLSRCGVYDVRSG